METGNMNGKRLVLTLLLLCLAAGLIAPAAFAAEGESLGITLLDHIVIGDREYVSIMPDIAEGSCGTCSDR